MDESELASLFTRLETDDRGALKYLYLYARGPLMRFFWQLSRRPDRIDDLIQGTFLKLWQYRGRFRGRGLARGYIYRIAMNEWHNQLIRDGRQQEIQEATMQKASFESVPPTNETVESEELRRRVRDAIEELPAAQREAFVLHRFEGLSCREIAEILGRSQKTVESRLRLALQKLTYKLSIAEGLA